MLTTPVNCVLLVISLRMLVPTRAVSTRACQSQEAHAPDEHARKVYADLIAEIE